MAGLSVPHYSLLSLFVFLSLAVSHSRLQRKTQQPYTRRITFHFCRNGFARMQASSVRLQKNLLAARQSNSEQHTTPPHENMQDLERPRSKVPNSKRSRTCNPFPCSGSFCGVREGLHQTMLDPFFCRNTYDPPACGRPIAEGYSFKVWIPTDRAG